MFGFGTTEVVQQPETDNTAPESCQRLASISVLDMPAAVDRAAVAPRSRRLPAWGREWELPVIWREGGEHDTLDGDLAMGRRLARHGCRIAVGRVGIGGPERVLGRVCDREPLAGWGRNRNLEERSRKRVWNTGAGKERASLMDATMWMMVWWKPRGVDSEMESIANLRNG